jgi:stringent starvation protein B
MIDMTDPRRHMLPALFSWMCENFEKVHLHAAGKCPGVVAPAGVAMRTAPCPVMTKDANGDSHHEMIYVEILTLNFGLMATSSFYQNDKGFGAKMRFNGNSTDVFLPFESIVAISSPDDIRNIAASNFSLYYGQETLAVSSKVAGEATELREDKTSEATVEKPRPHLRLVH